MGGGLGATSLGKHRRFNIKKVLLHIKIIYLSIFSKLVGLNKVDYLIKKADYLNDLELYSTAIDCFNEALNYSKDPFLYSSLGRLYLVCCNPEMAAKNYRIAYQNLETPDVFIGLAFAEIDLGNINEARRLQKQLNSVYPKLPEKYQANVKQLEVELTRITDSSSLKD
jgi:tetratricopeptide (TPR) repeat protein